MVTSTRTPNPRSIKFSPESGKFGFGGLHSFASAREAVGHTLAESLFAIPVVTNVLVLPEFVTVTVDEPASWEKWFARVLAVLEDAVLEER